MDWVDAVSLKQCCKPRIITLVEQTHRTCNWWFASAFRNLRGKPQSGERTFENTNVANANFPIGQSASIEHVNRQSDDFGLSKWT